MYPGIFYLLDPEYPLELLNLQNAVFRNLRRKWSLRNILFEKHFDKLRANDVLARRTKYSCWQRIQQIFVSSSFGEFEDTILEGKRVRFGSLFVYQFVKVLEFDKVG